MKLFFEVQFYKLESSTTYLTMATATTTTTSSPQNTRLQEKLASSTIQSSRNGSTTLASHYKDWPNTIGFETEYEQHTPVTLNVKGTIPAYAAGILFRTGPGTYKVTTNDGKVVEAHHWFDGFSVTHRFQLYEPTNGNENITKITYNSRRTCDGLIQKIKETGRVQEFGFAQKRDPCQSYFQKLMSTFLAATGTDSKDIALSNVGVALSVNMPGMTKSDSGVTTLTARTDANKYLKIDPETLEPAGACDQTVLHSDLKGPLSGTHAKVDPVTGDIFNYNLEFGRKAVYRVFQVSKATGETTILAKLEAPAAYLHSILLTEHTVILCVWNSYITHMGLSMLWNKNVLDSIAPLDPSGKAHWYVIDRTSARKGLIATFTTDPFFCFHTINAYEKPNEKDPGTVDIIADLVGYDDLSMLKSFYYSILTSSNATEEKVGGRKRATFRSYELPSIILPNSSGKKASNTKSRSGSKIHQAPFDHSMDLPTINPALYTHPYRYYYGITDHGKSSFADGLGKYDKRSGKAIIWREHAQTAGEPIFIPHPDADPFKEEDEDKGVLLSVVCDGIRELSYLLVLDAKTFKEVGRAEMEASKEGEVKKVVGFGFHGTHVKALTGEKAVKISAGD